VSIHGSIEWIRLKAREVRPIRTNDIGIAATVRAYRMPLVSRSARHFARVADLVIEKY
jgi:predicted nucleic acid-binding protein